MPAIAVIAGVATHFTFVFGLPPAKGYHRVKLVGELDLSGLSALASFHVTPS